MALSYPFEQHVNNSLVVREPLGVAVAITPWNYPLHQIAAKVAPALAAGCTVVLKPSEVAPLNAYILAEVFDSIGLPSGVFNLLTGTGAEVGEALVAHPDVDKVSFTGGPTPPDGLDRGYYVRPTVFSETTPDMAVVKDEIFGPVLVIQAYDDEDEAVALANDGIYGLNSAVMSADEERAISVGRRIRAGQVQINDGAFNICAPFGGYRQSGNGRELGKWGLEEFLETKSMQLPLPPEQLAGMKQLLDTAGLIGFKNQSQPIREAIIDNLDRISPESHGAIAALKQLSISFAQGPPGATDTGP